MKAEEIISFWFRETEEELWWAKNEAFDRKIRERFGSVHGAACRCETAPWRAEPLGRLAEIIVLDQFSRNMFRGTPRAFEQDPLALSLAQEALSAGAADSLKGDRLAFLCMPFMHSESARIQAESVQLFSKLRLEGYLPYALEHKEIVDRFGRFPHRNKALGRVSSSAEADFISKKADF